MLSVAHLSLGVGLSVQSKKSVLDCILVNDPTHRQMASWLECVENMECESGYSYRCINNDGDEFATCNADDCDMEDEDEDG